MSAEASTLPVRIHGLYLQQHEWELVLAILTQTLPDRQVWAFGSRATGLRLKRFSDLDLAVEGKLTSSQRAALSDALDESPLPFKVDVVELDLVDTPFRQRIKKDFVALRGA